MRISLAEIDLLNFLSLDKILSPGEVNELLREINKEVWFRVLHEELPKIISQAKVKELADKYVLNDDLEAILMAIKKEHPQVDWPNLLDRVVPEVKRDFINRYLETFQSAEGCRLAQEVKAWLENLLLSKRALQKFQEEIYRLATSVDIKSASRIRPM
jgi:hypothetical protein